MFKYKLTRQFEQLHQIFNTVIKYIHYFNFKPDNIQILATQMVPYFIKLDEIPKEMIKNNSSTIIYDVFNTSIYIMKEEYPNQSTMSVKILSDLVNKSKQNLDICRNIILTVQEYSDSVHYLQITSQRSFKGDKYCNGNNCLRNITNEQIYQFCTS
ncbi:MAG: hypothetical protein IJ019_00250 [Alphaproteobacteria bacterium]|nr:hypothetical protein [Alphaproteobacteria bacterium]